MRPETSDLQALTATPDRLLLAAVKTSLRDLARRWKSLDAEIKTLNGHLEGLVRDAAHELVELHGVCVEIAGQFLVTAGDNADRIRNEPAFAKLCGCRAHPPAVVAPQAGTA